jgi:hypothetical protein
VPQQDRNKNEHVLRPMVRPGGCEGVRELTHNADAAVNTETWRGICEFIMPNRRRDASRN